MSKEFNENILNKLPIAILIFDEKLSLTFFNSTSEFFPEFINVQSLQLGGNLRDILPALFSDENEKTKTIDNKFTKPFEIQLDNYTKLNGRPTSVIAKIVPLIEEDKFNGLLIAIEDLVLFNELSEIEIIKTSMFSDILHGLEYDFAIIDSQAKIYFKSSSFDEKAIEKIKNNFSDLLESAKQFEFGNGIFEFRIIPLNELNVSPTLYLSVVRDATYENEKLEKVKNELNSLNNVLNNLGFQITYDGEGKILENTFDKNLTNVFQIDNKIEREEFFKHGNSFVIQNIIEGKEIFYLAKISEYSENYLLTLIPIDENHKKEIFSGQSDFEKHLDFADYFFWETKKTDNSFKLIYYSENVKNILGYSKEEIINNKLIWLKIIHPHDRKRVVSALKQALNNPSSKIVEYKYRAIRKDGALIWLNEKVKIQRNENGEVIGMLGSVADITDLIEEAEEIIAENSKLKEINEAKDRFISIISHDLRSPFSSILGFTKLILQENPSISKIQEYVRYIENSAQSMLSLVNALLDWTRLQTGRIKFSPTKTRLSDVARSSVEMLLGSAIQKGIVLENNVSRNLFVHADKSLLSQVFNNLIGNAIKFTKAGDSITIFARKTADEKFVEVHVKDTGVGIKKEDLNKLFKVDEKFTNPGTAGEKGTGLGLSLVYEIVKKHGGDIHVESEYGKGTEFIFTLPVSSSIILLIDKIPAELILYSKLIKSLFPEFNILTASDLPEVEKITSEKFPVLIVTELKANDYDVFSFKKELDKKKLQPGIIVLSHDLNDAVKKELSKIGIDTAFSKPVNLRIFADAISKLLK